MSRGDCQKVGQTVRESGRLSVCVYDLDLPTVTASRPICVCVCVCIHWMGG